MLPFVHSTSVSPGRCPILKAGGGGRSTVCSGVSRRPWPALEAGRGASVLDRVSPRAHPAHDLGGGGRSTVYFWR